MTDFAKQKKVFFLAAEPLTDKITWQNGNRYTFRLRPGTYMQAAMLVPEAAKLKKKRWAVVYPNYEYGQSAAATFKATAEGSAARRRVRRRAGDAARPGRRRRVVQALADAKPDAIFNVLFGADLSKFVREGNTRGLFKGREVVSLLTGEPEYLDPLQGRGAERLDRHRLPLVRHPDATSTRRSSSPTTRKYKDYPRLGSVVGYSTIKSIAAGIKKAKSDRHREADRRLQRPAVRCRRSARSPTAATTTSRPWAPIVGKTKLEGGKGVMVDYVYLDGAKVLPSDDEVKKLAAID